MADSDRSLKLGIETDDSSVNKAKRRLNEIEKAQEELRDSFRQGARDVDRVTQSLNELEKEARALNRTLDTLENPRNIDVQGDFDKYRDVSLAGGADSALNALGGAASTFGGEGVGQVAGATAQIFGIIEAAPKLQAAFLAMPSAISQAAASLGLVGIGFGLISAAGLALITTLQNAEQKIVETNQRARDAFSELSREIADGSLTTEEVNRRLEENNRQREAEQRILEALEIEYQKYIEQTGALAGGVQAVSQVEEDRFKAIEEQKKLVEGLAQDEEGLIAARDSGALTANDMALAEERLADERRQALLDEASLAGELEALRLRAQDLSREQIEQELLQLERRRAAIEAELAVLQASGDTSEEVASRIQELNKQLENLGAQSEVLTTANETATSETELKVAREESVKVTQDTTDATKAKADADRQAEEQTRKLQQAQEQAARAQAQYRESVDRAKTAFKEAVADIGTDLSDGIADSRTEALDDIRDVETKFNREQLAAESDQQRELEKLRDDAKRAESDALRQRNFKQVGDSRDEAKETREQALQEFADEGQDRLLEAQYQRTDIVAEAERQTRDLQLQSQRQIRDAEIAQQRQLAAARNQLSIQDQTLKESLNMMQQWGKNFLTIQQQALGGGQGTGVQGANGSSNVGQLFQEFTSSNSNFGRAL